MRHWGCLWKAGDGGGAYILYRLPTPPCRCPVGAYLPCRLLALPLVFFPAPIPPTPFPAGRGEPRLFHARGFAPCIPGGWVGCGTGFACGKRDTAGGACFLCRLPTPPCRYPVGAFLLGCLPTLPGAFSFFHPHFPAGRQGTNHRVQSILNIREKFWGSGGLFQESPSVLPVVSPVPSAKAVRRERVRERPSRCMTI